MSLFSRKLYICRGSKNSKEYAKNMEGYVLHADNDMYQILLDWLYKKSIPLCEVQFLED